MKNSIWIGGSKELFNRVCFIITCKLNGTIQNCDLQSEIPDVIYKHGINSFIAQYNITKEEFDSNNIEQITLKDLIEQCTI
jgi:hypothetical protein